MRSVPRFWNRVNITTSSHQVQRRTVVCAGDSVLKFTEAGGHGQEAVISEAIGPWAAKVLRHVCVPIAIGEGVYYLDLLQQLTLEVEGPPAPFWALLLFALCWLAPRYIAADLGVSNMGVKAVYGLPVPVFFDLDPNLSGSGRGFVEAYVQVRAAHAAWPAGSHSQPLPKPTGGLPAAPWPDEYTGESFTQAQGHDQV